jgi:hypothetical protein
MEEWKNGRIEECELPRINFTPALPIETIRAGLLQLDVAA